MAKFAFTVPGKPQPWMRAVPYKGRVLTPKAMRQYQKNVGLCARAAGVVRLAGPVEIVIAVYLDGSFGADKRGSGDWDNFGKNICDALEDIAFTNDAQVVMGAVIKRVDSANPRTEVMLHGEPAPAPKSVVVARRRGKATYQMAWESP